MIRVLFDLQPLLCKFGKHKTLYINMQWEWGMCGPIRDECICCGKEFVWIYLGREDKMFDKCEVLDEH